MKTGNPTKKHGSTYETETLPPMETGEGLAPPDHVPGLTILCHPNPARIGELCRLPSLVYTASVDLSRAEPDFEPVNGGGGEPLDDPYLSRRPVTIIRHSNGTIEIAGALESTALHVDGQGVLEPIILTQAALEKGVVLELAHRIVLLFHLLTPPSEPRPSLGIIGESLAMQRVRDDILRVARTDVPVLLSGESGTGKELVAAAIHRSSGRAEAPYVAINMAAIPATMAAAELFGHVRGAFTGATSSTEGFFPRADGGTLFLDEVGDTPLDLQVLLLRVLETGEIQAIGAKQLQKVNVRLIAATDSDLGRAVQDGSLRLSFFQRLAGFQLEVPPLRARREDIGRLLMAFLDEELQAFDAAERLAPPVARGIRPWLAASVVARLALYDWPGNVRQLRNVVRQLVITYHHEPTLRIDAAIERMLELAKGFYTPPPIDVDARPDNAQDDSESDKSVADAGAAQVELTEDTLREALAACDWRPAAAARRLGIGRTTMYKLLAESATIRVATDIRAEELRDCFDRHEGKVETMGQELEVSARSLKMRLSKLGLNVR